MAHTQKYIRIDRVGGWVREHHSEPGLYVHVAGKEDSSSVYLGHKTSLTCGWCYLNAPHSEDAHASKVAENARARS